MSDETMSMLDDRIAELEDENAALQRENAALRSALTTLLAWEDKGGDIPPSAARGLFRIARAALHAARKEAKP